MNSSEISVANNEVLSQERALSSGVQLRTSARVLKKQKLDLEASYSASENKKDEKAEFEVTSSVQLVAPQSQVQVPTQPPAQVKRQRALCVMWSPEDKNTFFDALNEAGKDVEWIERYMRGKAKKRLGDTNVPTVTCKSRLQIKSFYQRTIAKISKYIQLPDNVKKTTQELYILINYGELRKRIALINERNAQKLKELIYCGSTQVRIKGKTWRVKTPVCRALKRLNQLEESVDEVKLPARVEVLVAPRENRDRIAVESMGFNPRVKTALSVDMPIVNLITYLQTRWSCPKEEVLTEGSTLRKSNLQTKTPDPGGGGKDPSFKPNPASSLSGAAPTVTTCTADSSRGCAKVRDDTDSSPCATLPDLSDCVVPSVNSTQEVGSGSPCWNLKSAKEVSSSSSSPPSKRCCQQGVWRGECARNAVMCDTSVSDDIGTRSDSGTRLWIAAKPNAPLTKTNYKCGQMVTSSCLSLIAHQAKIGSPLASLQNLIQVPNPAVKASKSWAKWHKEGEPVDELVNADVVDPTALPDVTSTLAQVPCEAANSSEGQVCDNSSTPAQPAKELTKEEFEGRVRKGWSVHNASRLRIADLYLIFGSGGRMEVEYWWEGERTSELPSLTRLLCLARLWYSGIPTTTRECWACGHRTTPATHTTNLIIDPKVEVKTEVVDNPNSSSAAAVVVVSPSPTTAGRFRQPLLPAPSSTKRLKSTDDTYKSLQLRPKYSNRRGRYRPKNVVVQRMLPLLPKASTSQCTVVTLQVVAKDPTGPATGEFIHSRPPLKAIAPRAPVPMGEKIEEKELKDESPINQSCLDDSPPSVNPHLSPLPTSFSGLIGSGSECENDTVSTPPPSPGRILKEGESQWLNSEVSDFSLSSFLGHLESPVKTNVLLPMDDSRMSADVDSQLQSLMTETSLDYTAKFADLAAKITEPGTSNGAPTAPS